MVSVMSNVETGHDDLIHDAQMDYYGTRLATCSSDRSIKIFDVKGKEQTLVAHLREHEGPVWQVAWAHPMYGNLLASCSFDRKVFIWQENGPHWTKIYEHTVHNLLVNSIAWAPHEHGLILACALLDGSVSILTYTAGQTWELKKINNAHNVGCNAVNWAPAQPSASVDGTGKNTGVQRLVTGGCDNYIKIWKYESATDEWAVEHKFEGYFDWVRDVVWAPSIGLPRSVIASCSQDRRVIIWVNDGATGNTWQQKDLGVFDDVVWNVSWSITGNILVVFGGDNKVSLWKETLKGEWICLSDSAKSASVEHSQH